MTALRKIEDNREYEFNIVVNYMNIYKNKSQMQLQLPK